MCLKSGLPENNMHQYSEEQKKYVGEMERMIAENSLKSTVVEMQTNYNVNQVTLTSVTFLPRQITEKITKKIIEPLRAIESEHYFYPPESMHLTIKNIRTVNDPPLFTPADAEKVNELFSQTVPQFPAFEFAVEDVIAFPTSISVMGYSDETLQKLVLALDKGLKRIGVPDNKKYISYSAFWGNITFCRFTRKPGEKFMAAVKKMRNLKIGKFAVKKVSLVTGNAVLHPDSKRIIAEYDLK